MKIGLVGLPLVGKTTFFNLLTYAKAETSSYATGKVDSNTGIANIPDYRIDFLAKMFNPEKTTYAQMNFTDVPGLVSGSSSGKGVGNRFLEDIRKVDAIVHIVRAFENPEVIHTDNTLDPMRDIETINMELLFADLGIIENRITRLEAESKLTKDKLAELEVLNKCREGLENGVLIHQIELSDTEKDLLKSFSFLSEKPMILAVNIDEDSLKSGQYQQKEQVRAYVKKRNVPVIEICAKAEAEISELEEKDRLLFMKELGITKSGMDVLAETTYKYLGLISFLTTGEDEVRAWTVKKDIDIRKAAGKIHSDIERGFIRAEVVKFRDIKELGSMVKVKQKGLYRLVGKEYIVEDGDIINFRFNV